MNDQSAAMKPRRDVSLDAPSTRQGQMDQDNRLGANQSQWRVGSVNLMNRYAMLWAKRKEGGVWRTASWVLLGAALWGMCMLFMFNSPAAMIGEYWPVLILAFVGALVANATAVGGGFIFMPIFSLYYGIGSLAALKLALATQAFGMTSGALAWSGKQISWRQMKQACFASGFGMFVGTFYWRPLTEVVDLYFGWISLAVGIALLAELCVSRKPNRNREQVEASTSIGYLVVCALGGLITAWVSIGVGEVVALWLLFRCHHGIAQAIATGVATLAFCSVLGFLFHIGLGGITWHYLAFTAPGAVIGSQVGVFVGKRLARPRIGAKQPAGFSLKALVAAVIFIDGVVVLHQASAS